jgi:hypothetical protein
MEKQIYINSNSLCPDICNEIISKFENEIENDNVLPGATSQGLKLNIKHTLDFCIDTANGWDKITKMLKIELKHNINNYIYNLNDSIHYLPNNNSGLRYMLFSEKDMCYDNITLQIQKYQKQTGKFTFHNDFDIREDSNYRIFTYLWYLNDVIEGGETVFFENHKIIPRAGTLVIFPANWSYPHSGKMPISSDKYIITGWIYTNRFN